MSPRSRDTTCPSYLHQFAPLRTEGAGKTGYQLIPMVRVQQKSTRQNHRLSRDNPAFPAQWCYGLYVLSPGTGFLAPVCDNARSAHCAGTSTGMPGPHDFAVPSELFVRSHCLRHDLIGKPLRTFPDHALARCNSDRPSHLRPNVRDDRDTSLSPGRDGRKYPGDLPDEASRAACGKLTRRAICAWRICANCPSCKEVLPNTPTSYRSGAQLRAENAGTTPLTFSARAFHRHSPVSHKGKG
jgi:hypothetical protein